MGFLFLHCQKRSGLIFFYLLKSLNFLFGGLGEFWSHFNSFVILQGALCLIFAAARQLQEASGQGHPRRPGTPPPRHDGFDGSHVLTCEEGLRGRNFQGICFNVITRYEHNTFLPFSCLSSPQHIRRTIGMITITHVRLLRPRSLGGRSSSCFPYTASSLCQGLAST